MPPKYLYDIPVSGSGQITKSITKHDGSMKNVNPIVEPIGPSKVAHLAQQYSNASVLNSAYPICDDKSAAVGIVNV